MTETVDAVVLSGAGLLSIYPWWLITAARAEMAADLRTHADSIAPR